MPKNPQDRKEVVGSSNSESTMEPKHKPSQEAVQRYLNILREPQEHESFDPLEAGWDHMKNSRGWS